MPITLRPKSDLIDSGLPWLGMIPKGWNVKKLKAVSQIVNGATPKSEVKQYWDGDVVWVTPDDISKNASRLIQSTKRHITRAGFKSCGTTMSPPNSIILSTRAPIGLLAINTVPVCTNQGCRGLAPRNVLNTIYTYYLLSSAKNALNNLGTGTTFLELSRRSLADFQIPLPPLPEQEAIAAFLDERTTVIDEAITAKKKLAELLKEKRTALIAHTVTKGLDPNADLIDSGLPWLGMIPKGWKTEKLRHLTELIVSNIDKKSAQGEHPVRLCNYVDVYKNETIDETIPFMKATASSDEIHRYRTKCGDVAITKDSEDPTDIGIPALIENESDDLVYGYHLAVLRPSKKLCPGFLMRTVQSRPTRYQFSRTSNGITRFSLLHQPIKNTVIPLPPLPEQEAIAAFLDERTAVIDEAMTQINHSIDLLTQYRTSLITAAVTGRIII